MSETKHTPGPRTVEEPMGPETFWIVEAGKQPHEWRCIAMVCQDDPANDEDRDALKPITAHEQTANARLIAAAPDLLKAAKQALAGLEAEYGWSAACANFPALYAAIAKAEGA